MSDVAEKIARAVLYEGHLLYPYRRSALKNRQPWSFGTLAPKVWAAGSSDPFQFHAECLAKASAGCKLSVRVRFLHLSRTPADFGESAERSVHALDLPVADLASSPVVVDFTVPGSSGDAVWQSLSGHLEVRAEPVAAGVVKIVVQVSNTTIVPPELSRDEALLHSLIAAHAALSICFGEFISLLDPPSDLAAAASACSNTGVYPVLVGAQGQTDQVLASPIILYDYPEIAPESPGDFFDATEMDEMLSLRVLTLTDEEKQEVAKSGEHARAILGRTESLPPEQLLKVHGVIRGMRKIEEGR